MIAHRRRPRLGRPTRRALAVIVVLGTIAPASAQDACHAKCGSWLKSCLPACADAPVVQQCRANCLFAYRQCIADCEDTSKLRVPDDGPGAG